MACYAGWAAAGPAVRWCRQLLINKLSPTHAYIILACLKFQLEKRVIFHEAFVTFAQSYLHKYTINGLPEDFSS